MMKFSYVMALANKCHLGYYVRNIWVTANPNKRNLETFAAGVLGKHVLYETTDQDRPKEICDRNGEVVLAQCKLCGKAEAELDMNARCKPRVKL